jgi:hypothetical protein
VNQDWVSISHDFIEIALFISQFETEVYLFSTSAFNLLSPIFSNDSQAPIFILRASVFCFEIAGQPVIVLQTAFSCVPTMTQQFFSAACRDHAAPVSVQAWCGTLRPGVEPSC